MRTFGFDKELPISVDEFKATFYDTPDWKRSFHTLRKDYDIDVGAWSPAAEEGIPEAITLRQDAKFRHVEFSSPIHAPQILLTFLGMDHTRVYEDQWMSHKPGIEMEIQMVTGFLTPAQYSHLFNIGGTWHITRLTDSTCRLKIHIYAEWTGWRVLKPAFEKVMYDEGKASFQMSMTTLVSGADRVVAERSKTKGTSDLDDVGDAGGAPGEALVIAGDVFYDAPTSPLPASASSPSQSSASRQLAVVPTAVSMAQVARQLEAMSRVHVALQARLSALETALRVEVDRRRAAERRGGTDPAAMARALDLLKQLSAQHDEMAQRETARFHEWTDRLDALQVARTTSDLYAPNPSSWITGLGFVAVLTIAPLASFLILRQIVMAHRARRGDASLGELAEWLRRFLLIKRQSQRASPGAKSKSL